MKTLLLFLLCLSTLNAEDQPAEATSLKTSEQHFHDGMLAFQKGDVAQALQSFEAAGLEGKELEPIQFNQALCHLALNEPDKAEELFNKVLSSQDPEFQIKAHYNLGHLYFKQSLKEPETAAGQEPSPYPDYDLEKLEAASYAFRDIKNLSRRYEGKLSAATSAIVAAADENLKLIAARYIDYEDRLAKRKGRKTNIIRGSVKVNGRPASYAFVYLKSKWDDVIFAHMRCDESGVFTFNDLEVGKYQLAALLYEEDNAERLNWGEDVKLPSFESDNHDLQIQGAMTLGVPYQTQSPSLETPWDDHLRFSGSQSIVSSTDWGELVDGRPAITLPLDNDFHQGYVGFNVPNLRLGIAVPTAEQAQPQQNVPQSTEPTPPPTFKIKLKGFQDFKDVFLPDELTVFGMKEGQEAPLQLYQSIIQSTSSGVVEWDSEEFAHQDCRQLMLDFKRSKGNRMSLHEIEVSEDRHEPKQDQQEGDEQNKDQQQEQNQDQEQQNKNDKQQQPQEPQDRESRTVRSILEKVKEKNEDAKERQKGSGVILHTDKDY